MPSRVYAPAMIRISIEQLKAAAATRPGGYCEEVIGSGQIKDGVLLLDESVYQNLLRKYSPDATNARKIKNVTRAGVRVVSSILGGKPVLVSDEEKKRRMAICTACEFFTGTTCRKCGCHIRFKAKLQTEHCPICKW